MIPFNFRLLFRLTYRSLFKSRGTHARLTRKRVIFLLGFYLIFVPMQLMNGVFLLLDNVLFPGYRRVEVKEPVFIIGNPRSGSTHLLRVLARDEQTFACARLWEVLLAPSITQRRIVRTLAALDRRLGSPAERWLGAWQERAFPEADKYHKIRFREPDEDELNFLSIFSAIHLVFPFPFPEEFAPYIYFDTEVSPAEKKRFIAFYKRSMQRTLYEHGPTKRLLSKTPANSGRIGTLCKAFPDAKVIYTTRNPATLVPSTMSLFSFQSGVFCDLLDERLFREPVLEMTKHWYRYPIQRLEGRPTGTYAIVRHDDLVQDLEQTVIDTYTALGFDISPEFARALKEEVEKARQYTSRHRYSLEEMGLTQEQILAEYQDVFERFGFETPGDNDRSKD